MIILVAAKPFITLWAGSDYASAVTPFYILVLGLIFNVMAFAPVSLLTALGKANTIARCHLLELAPYIIGAAVLTYLYGAKGAAAAWSLRVFVDAILQFSAAGRTTAFAFAPMRMRLHNYALMVALLALPILFVSLRDNNLLVKGAVLSVGLLIYVGLVWRKELSAEERAWMSASWRGLKQSPVGQKT